MRLRALSAIDSATITLTSPRPSTVNTCTEGAAFDCRMQFIPLLSSHIVPGEKPLNYIIHKDGRCVLYACDSFRFSPETWHAICDHRYDLVVIECSRGDADSSDENDINARAHLNFEQGIEMYKEFVQADLLTDKGIFAFSHLSHHAGSHDEAAARLARHKITIAYDGMKLEL